jgi:transcriptional regulator with XRE-family HTH domain
MKPNLDDLAQDLQKIRKAQGLSREDLASLARVSASFVRDAERDPNSCSFGKLNALCAALGLNWQLHKNGERLWPEMVHVRITVQPANASASGVTAKLLQDSS